MLPPSIQKGGMKLSIGLPVSVSLTDLSGSWGDIRFAKMARNRTATIITIGKIGRLRFFRMIRWIDGRSKTVALFTEEIWFIPTLPSDPYSWIHRRV